MRKTTPPPYVENKDMTFSEILDHYNKCLLSKPEVNRIMRWVPCDKTNTNPNFRSYLDLVFTHKDTFHYLHCSGSSNSCDLSVFDGQNRISAALFVMLMPYKIYRDFFENLENTVKKEFSAKENAELLKKFLVKIRNMTFQDIKDGFDKFIQSYFKECNIYSQFNHAVLRNAFDELKVKFEFGSPTYDITTAKQSFKIYRNFTQEQIADIFENMNKFGAGMSLFDLYAAQYGTIKIPEYKQLTYDNEYRNEIELYYKNRHRHDELLKPTLFTDEKIPSVFQLMLAMAEVFAKKFKFFTEYGLGKHEAKDEKKYLSLEQREEDLEKEIEDLQFEIDNNTNIIKASNDVDKINELKKQQKTHKSKIKTKQKNLNTVKEKIEERNGKTYEELEEERNKEEEAMIKRIKAQTNKYKKMPFIFDVFNVLYPDLTIKDININHLREFEKELIDSIEYLVKIRTEIFPNLNKDPNINKKTQNVFNVKNYVDRITWPICSTELCILLCVVLSEKFKNMSEVEKKSKLQRIMVFHILRPYYKKFEKKNGFEKEEIDKRNEEIGIYANLDWLNVNKKDIRAKPMNFYIKVYNNPDTEFLDKAVSVNNIEKLLVGIFNDEKNKHKKLRAANGKVGNSSRQKISFPGLVLIHNRLYTKLPQSDVDKIRKDGIQLHNDHMICFSTRVKKTSIVALNRCGNFCPILGPLNSGRGNKHIDYYKDYPETWKQIELLDLFPIQEYDEIVEYIKEGHGNQPVPYFKDKTAIEKFHKFCDKNEEKLIKGFIEFLKDRVH